MRVIHANNTETIDIGRQLENLVTEVVFDLSNWIAEFGDGTAALIVRRVGDYNTYPVLLERQDSEVIWKVTSADTELAQKGRYGRCELRWYVGDVLVKSNIWKLYVEPSMTGQSGTTPPTPEQSWVDKVLEAGNTAENAATIAKDSASAAATSAAEAKASEIAAKVSETAAAGSADTAENSATSASVSASAASESANVAAASKTAAKSSEEAAKISETAAKASEVAAKASETAANGSASEAADSATSALTSASVAAQHANTASISADNAELAAQEATARAEEVLGGDFATKTEVQGSIDTHNSSNEAHADIREKVSTVESVANAAIQASEKGAANGVATLGEDTLLAAAQRPKAGGLYRDDGVKTLEESFEEIDAELNGKAPAGFGFGEKVVEVRTKSADETYETYCAKLDAVLEGMGNNVSKLIGFYPPAIYGMGAQIGLLHKWDANEASVRSLGNYDGVAKGFFGVSMRKVKGTWQPMEWINPPMTLGVEYRTTERFNGMPVYTKVINAGAFPNNGRALVPYSDDTACLGFDCYGYANNGKSLPTYSASGVPNMVLAVCTNMNNVELSSNFDATSITASYVVVKYAK